MLHFKL